MKETAMAFREALVPRDFRQDDYYIVEYDFKGACGGKSNPQYRLVYRDFKEAFGQDIRRYRSTDSVLIIKTLEDAKKAASIILRYGGEVRIRRCVPIDLD